MVSQKGVGIVISLCLLILLAVSGFMVKVSPTQISIRVEMYIFVGTEAAHARITDLAIDTGRYSPDNESFELRSVSNETCPKTRYWISLVLNETGSQPITWEHSIGVSPDHPSQYNGYVAHSVSVRGNYRLTVSLYVEVAGEARLADVRSEYLQVF